MSDARRGTRWAMLKALLKHRGGMTIEEMTAALGISRNAVRQHLTLMERDGLVAPAGERRAVGRPSQVYSLTPAGKELFPRQYSWLSGLILGALRASRGPDGVRDLLNDVAEGLLQQLRSGTPGGDGGPDSGLAQRVARAARMLDDLDYVADNGQQPGPLPYIRAVNCVYHQLAQEHPEICALDVRLIEGLTGGTVEHTRCMVWGDGECRFVVRPRDAGS